MPLSLKQQITEDMKTAMKARDASKLDAIRLLKAGVQRREVDERIELDDEGVLSVIQKMVKQSRDAITQFEAGGRNDLVSKEQQLLSVLESYLPKQLSVTEIEQLVSAAISQTGAQSIKDMGKVMGKLKSELAGRADMGQVSLSVKQALANL
jgi:uncharacterized protein YqeY